MEIPMRVIVAGMGVQGQKRLRIAGTDAVATVDPVADGVDYQTVEDIPLDSYDAALLCVPDTPKVALLRHLLSNGKHALVEKPLFAATNEELHELEQVALKNDAVCYTAYNHRFEPHYVKMANLISGGTLGRIYRCRMFYGNGTARLVRDSAWRDEGAGVLPDLGSHLLDTCRYWFGDIGNNFHVVSANRFENQAPDHVVIASETTTPRIELEMTLLSWRNHFTCDLFAENGSAHISSLCKWGPTTFAVRHRVLPSGRPPEEAETLSQDDPTWALEYAHFKKLCASRANTDLSNDKWLNLTLSTLGKDATDMAQGEAKPR
jgi:scyllo-inositol 2-dehydrogenase (NADP+)